MSTVLYHHGILGQKWGVRRYQNEDGTLTSAGRQRKKAPRNYDYKESAAYKNKAKSSQRAIDRQYASDSMYYGRKLASQRQYDELERGMSKNDANKQLLLNNERRAQRIAIGTAVAFSLIDVGYAYYKSSVAAAKVSSDVVSGYGKEMGLNEVKGGFSSGLKQVVAGKKFVQRLHSNGMI